MGFWGGLLKGLGVGGAAIAAPFTGGGSAAIIPAILGGAGAVANGISQGRAAGRVQEAGINNNQDVLKLRAAQQMEDALRGRANLDLNQRQQDLSQRQFALQAPQARAKNSVRGDVLAGAQDFNVSGPITHTGGKMPTITGGLRPSLFSNNTRELGGLMSRDALLGQMQGDKFEPFQPLPAPQVPGITPTPQSGKLDSFLNVLGGAGALAQLPGLINRPDPYKVKRPPSEYPEDWQTEGLG